MKTKPGLIIAISAMVLLFASCNKSNEISKMIPGDALFVAGINMKSVSQKISWNEIKQTAWFQKAYSDSSTPDWRKQILDNPGASGIDFEKNLTFFANKMADNRIYIVAVGEIKNEKDFEQFNKNFDPSQNVTKSGDVNLLILKDKNVLGWQDKRFAYVMNSNTTSSEMYNWRDSVNNQSNTAPIDKSASLSAYCTSLFSLKADSSLAKNDKFSKLLKDKGDLYFWSNSEEAMRNNPSLGMLSMLKLDVFLNNNYSAFTVNFDKGKIEIDQKQYMSKELTDFFKKYNGSKINKDMISKIPSQNVLGIFAANFKPQAIEEFIKLTGADGIANMYLQQYGFNMADFSKANNGNMLLTFTDLNMKPDTLRDIKDSAGKALNFMVPDAKFSLIMDVKDQPSFRKINDAGKKLIAGMHNDTAITMVLSNKYFVASNSSSFATDYLAAKNDNKFDFIDKIDGHPMGGFMDLHKIFTILSSQETNNEERKALMDENLKFWNYISMKGGEMKNGALTAEIEINMLDQNTNSLKTLNNFANEMFKINEAKRQRNGEKRKLDSLLTPPPMDTIRVK